MSEEIRIDSILAIDMGSVMTKAVLVARVEGTYRFIARAEAPSTHEPPWLDVHPGVQHALNNLAMLAGRELVDKDGNLITPERADGRGVDACVLTTSAAHPLRTVLVGLSPELSISNLKRAASGVYAEIVGVISRAGNAEGHAVYQTEEDRVRQIFHAHPDVICVAGGTDGGAEKPVLELMESAALAASLSQDPKPKIIFAGNASLRSKITEAVGTEAELRVIDNVYPSIDLESITPAQIELETLYEVEKISKLAGYGAVEQWTTLPTLPTARALGNVVQYLSMGNSQKGVLAVDVGGSSTTIAAARGGQLALTVRADLGSAYSAHEVLKAGGAEAISRWLPFDISPGEIEAIVIQRTLYPASLPFESQEMLVEQAIARQALRLCLAAAQPTWPPSLSAPYPGTLPYFEPIIGGGSVLGHAPRNGQAALILLDALEPIGVSTLLLDVYGLMPALGAAAMAQPLAAVQALGTAPAIPEAESVPGSSGLIKLATVIAPIVGRSRPGKKIMTVEVSSLGQLEVKQGSLEVWPLQPGETAELKLHPDSDVDVGRGGRGRGGKPIKVEGGLVGLIVDARGRPLQLPPDPAKRRERVQQWLWDVGA
jgi:hypothetical protein